MKKSDINPLPQYYDRYINLVPDVELSQAFDDSLRQLNDLDRNLLAQLGDKSYAPGKWTLKDIIQHLTDGERIMSYRALMFARDNGSRVEGFDQEVFGANADTSRRTTDDLLEELIGVRRSTRALYDSFTEQMLVAKGLSWEHEISVLALGFMMLGHQIHHLNVIAEKYLPLSRSA
jgi:hypothetical protein